jgi:hypothetical protein
MTENCIRSAISLRMYFAGSNSTEVSPLGMLNALIPFSPLSISDLSSFLLTTPPKTKIHEHLDKLEKHEKSSIKKALMHAEELVKGRGLPVGTYKDVER